jgi:hypothetical protein
VAYVKLNVHQFKANSTRAKYISTSAGGKRDVLVDWERWVEAGGGEPWRRRHRRAEDIAPGWLVPSVCLILGLAGRPSWMVDGRRQQTWPFYSCLDQIYRVWSTYMYNTCICIVPVIFSSKLLGVHLYTHVHILRPPMLGTHGWYYYTHRGYENTPTHLLT